MQKSIPFLLLCLLFLNLQLSAETSIPMPQISMESGPVAALDFEVLVPRDNFLTSKDRVWVQIKCLRKTNIQIASHNIVCEAAGKLKNHTLGLNFAKNTIWIRGIHQQQRQFVFRTYPVALPHSDERTQKLSILLARVNPSGKYELNKPVTRGELAWIFDKISFARTPEIKFYALPDVPGKHPWQASIQRVVGAEWLGVDEQNRFFPEKILTRVEMLTAVLRYADMRLSQTQTKLPFRDVSAKSWYFPVVLTALSNNLLTGGVKLNPNEKITRMELFTTLLRLPEMKDVLNPWK